MSSTDKVAEYFDAHGATEEEKEPMRDSTQKLKSYGIEKVSKGKWRHSNDVHTFFWSCRHLPLCEFTQPPFLDFLLVSLQTSPKVLMR